MTIKRLLTVGISLCVMLPFLLTTGVSAAAVEAGGWQFSEIAADNLTAEERAVFDQAMEGLVGVDYTPKDVIATQVVAGTNYAFLCVGTPVVPEAESGWYIVAVYEDLENKAELLGIAEIDPGNISTAAEDSGMLAGGWHAAGKSAGVSISKSVDQALASNEDVSLVPTAVLGTQIVVGTNYRVLAYGTPAMGNSEAQLYLAQVYEDLEGGAEITSLELFDVTAYIDPFFTEETGGEESSGEAGESSAVSAEPAENGPSVPLIVGIVLAAVLAVGAVLFVVLKKRG